jgi:hypothetical protein
MPPDPTTMNKQNNSPEMQLLLNGIDEAYSSKAWHGPNLRGSLRGVTAEMAAWRPDPKRHNIWEIVVHAAYWKYIVRRRLLEEKRGSFALKGSNWFPRPVEASEQAWRQDLKLLDTEHARLRQTIAGLKRVELNFKPTGSQVSNVTLIAGIASHDIYHAGQVQLLKRLRR